MTDELAYRNATELLGLLRSKQLSSRELLELCLARIERYNPALNAVVSLDAERAFERARACDDERARGIERGPLHGLPMTIKDAYETAGLRTTAGAPKLANHVPTRNATAVQRLVDAGAIVFGKTNVPKYSADVQTYNELFGITRNPYDPSRTPGGSSGGAAVALACGFTPLELGSDIGGSIRTPANWTGVFGHKPSYGLVPQRGHVPWAPGALAPTDLAVCGPLARSASDLVLELSVIAGPDEREARAFRLELPPPRRTSLSQYRIAAWLDDRAFPVASEVREVLEALVSALGAAGARVDVEARPDFSLSEAYENYLALLTPIMLAELPPESLSALEPLRTKKPENAIEAELVRYARHGLASHVAWLRERERQERYRARLADFFERYDVLLCPVTPVAAIVHDTAGTTLDRQIQVDGVARPYMELLAWISLATAGYLPASVAPAGRTRAGLPVGVQIVGPYLEDRTPLDIAARIAELSGGFVPPAL